MISKLQGEKDNTTLLRTGKSDVEVKGYKVSLSSESHFQNNGDRLAHSVSIPHGIFTPNLINASNYSQLGSYDNFREIPPHKYNRWTSVSTPSIDDTRAYIQLKEDVVINGIEFRQGEYLEFDGNGKLWRVGSGFTMGKCFDHHVCPYMNRPFTLVIIHSNQPHSFSSVTFDGIRRILGVPCTFEAQFNRQNYIVKLADDYNFEGIVCKRMNSASLYRSGKLKQGTLARDYIFSNGVELKANEEVYLTSSGSIDLSSYSTLKINGVHYKVKGLVFNSADKLEKGILLRDSNIQNILFKGDTEVEYFSSGGIKEGILAGYKKFENGVELKAGDRLKLNEDGSLNLRDLAVVKVNGINFKGSSIQFNALNRIESGILVENTRKQNIWFKANTEMKLHNNGNVKEGVLLQSTEFTGSTIEAGMIVQLNEDGTLNGFRVPE